MFERVLCTHSVDCDAIENAKENLIDIIQIYIYKMKSEE